MAIQRNAGRSSRQLILSSYYVWFLRAFIISKLISSKLQMDRINSLAYIIKYTIVDEKFPIHLSEIRWF